MESQIIDFENWRVLVAKLFLNFSVSIDDGPPNGDVDVQANTFAFGVILLELISGRATLSKDTGDLVDWVSILSVSKLNHNSSTLSIPILV